MPTQSSVASQVTFDSRSLIINEQRVLLICGEMHFSRMPRAEWESVIVRSKELGLNAIAFYVFWSIHEPQNGRFNFEGEADIGYFLDLCAKHEMFVIIRPGPYCCAEWNYGGFPFWLREVPGVVTRTWNEAYLFHVRRYFTALWEQIRPRFYPSGPIVLAQVENEYDNIAAYYGEAGQRYMQWMVELGDTLGMPVPTITCSGAADGAIECVNGFSVKDSLEKVLNERPGQPGIWTENWPGWYNTWGHDRHVRLPGEVSLEIVRFLMAGGTTWNYYVWHGGTNFGRTSMYLQTTRYGLDAPLNEWGMPTAKAHALAKLHEVVHQYQSKFLDGQRRQLIDLPPGVEGTLWAEADEEFIALANIESAAQQIVLDGWTMEIPARGACFLSRVSDGGTKILWCNWNQSEPRVPMSISETHEEEMEWHRVESVEAQWNWSAEPLPSERVDGMESFDPVEQLRLTQDNSDYCWYVTEIQQHGKGVARLVLRGAGDFFYLFVNGTLAAQTAMPLLEARGAILPTLGGKFDPATIHLNNGGSDFCQAFDIELEAGENRLEILSCAVGLIKGDWSLSAPMQEERKGIWGQVFVDGSVINNWRMYPRLQGERHLSSDTFLFDAEHTAPQAVDKPVWFKTQCLLSSEMLSKPFFAFDADGLYKGMIWVNGRCLSRYWQEGGHGYGQDESWQPSSSYTIDDGKAPQRRYRIPQSWLREENEIIVLSETGAMPRKDYLCYSA